MQVAAPEADGPDSTSSRGGPSSIGDHESTGASGRARALGPLLRRVVLRCPRLPAMGLLALAIVPLTLWFVAKSDPISPIDELVHLDYLIRASDGEIVLDPGAPLAQETLAEAACHGAYAITLPDCGLPSYEATDYIWKGLNPGAGHTPTYYVATGLIARAANAILPGHGVTSWARLAGAGWFLLGAYLVLRAGDALRLRRTAVVTALLLVAVTPASLIAMTMVNPDVTAFAAGGAILLAVVRFDLGRPHRWEGIVAAAVFAGLTDPTNLMGVIGGGVYLLVRSFAAPDLRARLRWVAASVLGGAVTVAVLLLWASYLGRTVEPIDVSDGPHHQAYLVESLPLDRVLGRTALFSMLPPVESEWPPPFLRTEAVGVFTSASSLLLVGAAIGRILQGRARDRISALAAAGIGGVVIGGPLFILRNYVLSSWYFPPPARYGLSVLPVLTVVLAGVTTTRTGRLAAGAVVVLGWAAVIAALWTGVVHAWPFPEGN